MKYSIATYNTGTVNVRSLGALPSTVHDSKLDVETAFAPTWGGRELPYQAQRTLGSES